MPSIDIIIYNMTLKESIMHEGHRKRLRQRFIQQLNEKDGEGASNAPSQAELAELLLTYAIPRKDVAPIAGQLVARYGSLKNAAKAPYGDAEDITGISESTSVLLKLMDRVYAEPQAEIENAVKVQPQAVGCEASMQPERARLVSVGEAAEFCRRLLSGCSEEYMLQVLLGEGSAVLGAFFIASGTGTGVELPAELIAANADIAQARGVVIAHNHPSGDIRPSAADVNATRNLKKLLQKHGCRL